MEALPRTDANLEVERSALNRLDALSIAADVLLRRDAVGPDIGQDATLEFPEPGGEDGVKTWRNTCVSVQSKGSHARMRKDGATMFRLEVKNLNYLNSAPALYWAWDAKTDRGFLRWRDDIVRELDQRPSDWQSQDTVIVPFRDEATVERLRAFGEDARASYARLRAAPRMRGVVRDLLAGRLPAHLQPRSMVVGRTPAIEQISDRIRPRALIWILGAPGSGKTDLVRQALEEPDIRKAIRSSFDTPVDLLYLEPDARVGERALLRALWIALDEPIPQTFDEHAEDLTTVEEQKARMLLEVLPRRLEGANHVLVIDGLGSPDRSSAEATDTVDVLCHANLADGLAIATSWTEPNLSVRGMRTLAPPVELGPLDRNGAAEILVGSGADPTAAQDAVDLALAVDAVLYPDIVERAANLHASQPASRHAESESETLADCLLDASGLWVRDALDRALGAGSLAREPRVLDVMTAWALIGQAIPAAMLEKHGFTADVSDRLDRARWLTVEADALRLDDEPRRGLRLELLRRSANADLDDICTIVADILADLASTENGIDADALEEGLAWLRRRRAACRDLETILLEWLVVLSADQPILPFGEEDRERRWGKTDSTAPQAIASAVFASLFGDESHAFAEDVDRAAKKLCEGDAISAAELRALDTAAFFGSRRLRADSMLLSARERLVRHLAGEAVLASLQPPELKWATSWSVNTAHVAINLGKRELALASVDAAREMLRRMPKPGAAHVYVDQHALWSRLHQAQARLASVPGSRLEALKLAAWHARDILAIDRRERWVIFCQRAYGRILNEECDDDARVAAADAAYDAVSRAVGPPHRWSPSVASGQAHLMLQTARYSLDPALQDAQAMKARDFLQARSDDIDLWLRGGIGEPTLQLARCHELLAYLHHSMDRPRERKSATDAALRCLEGLVRHCPSAAAWFLLLKTSYRDEVRAVVPLQGNVAGSRTERFVDEAEQWLDSARAGEVRNAHLALWIVERRWRSEGSLLKMAHGLRFWESDDNVEKRHTLARLYGRRRSRLKELEERYGTNWAFMRARVRLERQYQRSVAQYTQKNAYDPRPVLSLFEEAHALWPDQVSVLIERAKYYVFVWSLPEARRDLHTVIASAVHGNDRRRAAVLLARVLVDGAAYSSLPEPTADLLAEAREALDSTGGFRMLSYERALLGERIAFEAGEDPGWARLDDVYVEVVGGLDRYTDTVVANLDELLAGRLDAADDFASVVKRRYTDAEALSDLGSLYLRRAMKYGTDVDDPERAFACFDAARIVHQRDREGGGEPVLWFRRASAILEGARLKGRPTPFDVGQLGHETALDVAARDLSRVLSRAMGNFREIARRRQAEVDRARRRMAQ